MGGKSKVKTLQKKAEKLWKEIAILRDGRECQVKKHYPNINIHHSSVFQVDHFISRKNKHLFLDTSNATVVCSSCNQAKKYKLKSVDIAIQEIVKRREGEDIYNRMIECDMTMGPNVNWSKVWWLEEQIDILESIKKEMENERGNGGVLETRTREA